MILHLIFGLKKRYCYIKLAIFQKKTILNGYMYNFSVDYNTIDVSDIINIHKYLM